MASAIADTTAYAVRALAAGVARDSIVIDPAHDFGKTTRDSLDLTRRLDEMVATGWPVLVSLSNKDFVGESLDLPVGEQLVQRGSARGAQLGDGVGLGEPGQQCARARQHEDGLDHAGALTPVPGSRDGAPDAGR